MKNKEIELNKLIELCQEMRKLTGCGIMDAKKCLIECDGDMEKAIAYYKTLPSKRYI